MPELNIENKSSGIVAYAEGAVLGNVETNYMLLLTSSEGDLQEPVFCSAKRLAVALGAATAANAAS